MFFTTLFLYSFITPLPIASEERALLDAVFWEVKPYIFTNNKGDIDGIIPRMFEQAQHYCLPDNGSIKIINFTKVTKTRKEFYDLVRSNTSYGDSLLQDIEQSKAFWAPIISSHQKEDTFVKDRNLRIFQLIKSTNIAVIVPRSMIYLPNKILRGILSCQQILVLAILLAVIFGMILWVIERYKNENFPCSFIKGLVVSFYWSIVSMTTVGYGDITPHTVIGRFVTLFWLFIGVLMGCVMTATMTDIVISVSDLDIYGKTVSVLENSFEQRVAEQNYRASVLPAHSYDEVIRLVRQEKVFAAMINADVAAWYQDEIESNDYQIPLQIVQTLPANLYVNCFLPANVAKAVKIIFKCMYFQRDEVYTYSIEQFQRNCHTQTLYIGSMIDLFRDNVYVQILLGFVSTLIILGISFDLYRFWFPLKEVSKGPDEDYSPGTALVTNCTTKDTLHMDHHQRLSNFNLEKRMSAY